MVERDEKALARELAGDSASQRGDSTEALSCWREALEILEERNSFAAAARVACKMAALEEANGRADDACAQDADTGVTGLHREETERHSANLWLAIFSERT
jgi:hypothetical protein